MRSKLLIILICNIFYVLPAVAQLQNIYFLKNSGSEVKTLDSADFVRVISEPDSGETLFNIKEYYKNGKMKFIGKTSTTTKKVLEGRSLQFYPNGKKKQIASYVQGHLNGDAYEYYPNGKLYSLKQYIVGPELPGQYLFGKYLFKTCNDSLGKSLLFNGNGHAIIYDDDFKNIEEVGNIKAGLKDGVWTGKTPDSNQISYAENYTKGILISGHSIDKNGGQHNYTVRDEAPRPPDMKDIFYKAITLKFRTPADFKASREVKGQDRVLVSFNVEVDGSITDFKIIGSLDTTSRSELLNAIEKSTKKWLPGTLCGIPVKQYVCVPYNFTPAY